MGDILTFPNREGSKLASLPLAEPEKLFSRETLENFTDVGTLPRKEFGLRKGYMSKRDALQNCSAIIGEIVRDSDHEQQNRVKAAAREARNVFDKRHVDPTLRHSLAARIEGMALHANALAEQAKALGELSAVTQLREIAQDCETLAARLEITP